MKTAVRFNYKNFRLAALVTVVIAMVLFFFSYWFGKEEFYILLNNDFGWMGDFFFNYGTHLGDGIIWIVWLVVIFRPGGKQLLPLIISSLILSTTITQLGKQFVYPNEFRPSEALKMSTLGVKEHDEIETINGEKVVTNPDVFKVISKYKKGDDLEVAIRRSGKADTLRLQLKNDLHLHFVDGVEVHTYSSFPSGHTSTAFSFALIISLLTGSMGVTILCVVAALLVGYTRVYLGQHFPMDVGAGMIVAFLSVTIAIFVQRWFDRQKMKKVIGAEKSTIINEE